MPADEVTNLWLTSEETCLVDQETGAQYRIRRTEPDTFRKHFTVRAKKGDVLDLKIFFAPLAETTKEVRIYGLPNWGMMGVPITIRYQVSATFTPLVYDTIPQLHKPYVHKEHLSEDKPYDMQNWTTEYRSFGHDIKLVDETGHQYKIREIQGLPMDELFFMEGMAGDYVAYVLVFDPLPLELTKCTYIEPEGEPFSAWGANWSGSVQALDIQQLRENQRLFDYHPRVIVK